MVPVGDESRAVYFLADANTVLGYGLIRHESQGSGRNGPGQISGSPLIQQTLNRFVPDQNGRGGDKDQNYETCQILGLVVTIGESSGGLFARQGKGDPQG